MYIISSAISPSGTCSGHINRGTGPGIFNSPQNLNWNPDTCLANDHSYNFTNNKFYNGSITGGDNGTVVKLGGTMEIPYNTFITNWQNGPRSKAVKSGANVCGFPQQFSYAVEYCNNKSYNVSSDDPET